MSELNKETLNRANAAILNKDHEGFLSHCTDDTEWHFLGDKTLRGKSAVRAWLAATYLQPPKLNVHNIISEGDHLAVYGEVAVKDKSGKETRSYYCDVWRFRDGKLAELRAYVVEEK